MIEYLKIFGVLLVFLGIANGVLSLVTKGILRKHGYETFPLFSQISDIKKLKKLIEEDTFYRVLYYFNIVVSILFGVDVLLVFVTILLI